MPDPEGGTPVRETFSSAEGRFRIGLPDAASTGEENDSKTFKWFIFNQGQFQIMYVDRDTPADTPDNSQAILNKAREISSRGKLTGDSEISASGHPGREFRRETDGGGTQIDRIYLAGNRVYILNVFVPKSLYCKVGSAVKVLDTFEITE